MTSEVDSEPVRHDFSAWDLVRLAYEYRQAGRFPFDPSQLELSSAIITELERRESQMAVTTKPAEKSLGQIAAETYSPNTGWDTGNPVWIEDAKQTWERTATAVVNAMIPRWQKLYDEKNARIRELELKLAIGR